MVTPNSMSQLLLRSASPSSSSRAFTNMSISASPAISGGSSLITLTLSAALGEYPVAVEERHDEGLGEHGRAGGLDRAPAKLRAERGRRPEGDADHLSAPAHLVEELVALDQLAEPGVPHVAHGRACSTTCSSSKIDSVASPANHRQLVALEGGRVHHGAIHRAEDAAEDLVARQHGRDRHVAPERALEIVMMSGLRP